MFTKTICQQSISLDRTCPTNVMTIGKCSMSDEVNFRIPRYIHMTESVTVWCNLYFFNDKC